MYSAPPDNQNTFLPPEIRRNTDASQAFYSCPLRCCRFCAFSLRPKRCAATGSRPGDARRANRVDADDLWRAAKIDRVSNIMRPYLEAMP